MNPRMNGIAALLLVTCAASAEAQRARPTAPPAQSGTVSAPATATTMSSAPTAQPSTVTVPDEATTGRTAAPGQAGTAPGQAGTTPGQEQATPGQATSLTPAVTGQTPSGQATGRESSMQVTAATRSDIKAGALVYDQSGASVGKIESVNAKGAVISTGTARATIPISSFGKGDKGLVIGMSKADLDASAKKKSPK